MSNVGNLDLRINLDTKIYKKQLKKIDKELTDLRKKAQKPININVSLDISGAKKNIDKLKKSMPKSIKSSVVMDTSSANKSIDKLTSKLPRKISSTVDIDTSSARRQVDRLSSDVRSLGSISPTIDINTSAASAAIEKIADGIRSLSQIGVTAGLAGGVVGANAYTSRTQAVSSVTAGTTLSGDDSKKIMDAIVKYQAAGYGDYNGAAASINSLTAALTDGTLSSDNLSRVLSATMTAGAISATSNGTISTEDITKAMHGLMKNFGVDQQKALDAIAYGSKNGLNFAGDYADTLNEYSEQYRNSGYNLDEMVGSLVAGKKAGIYNTDTVGDITKEAPLQIQDLNEAKTNYLTEKGVIDDIKKLLKTGDYKAINKIVVDTIGKEENVATRDAMVTNFFGGVGENATFDGIKAIVNSQAVDTSGTSSQLQTQYEASTKTIADFNKGLEDLKTSLMPLGVSLMELATDILPPVIEKLTKMVDWFTSLSDGTKLAVIAIAGITAMTPAIGLFAAGLTKSIGAIASFIASLRAGAGGSAGAGLDVDGDSDGKNKKKSGKLSKLASAAGKLGKKAPVIGTIAGVAGVGAAAMAGDWGGAAQAGGGLAGGLAGAAGGAAIGTMIMPGIGTAIGGFAGGVAGAMGGEAIAKHWDSIWSTIISGADNFGTSMLAKASSIGTGIGTAIGATKDFVKNNAGLVFSAITGVATLTAGLATKIGATLATNFVNGLLLMVDFVKNNASTVFGSITAVIQGIATDVVSIGGDIVSGLWSGISGGVDWLKGKVTGFASSVADWAREALDIHSPSRVFKSIGGYVTEGLGDGITDKTKYALSAMTGLTSSLVDAGHNMAIMPSSQPAVIGNYIPSKTSTGDNYYYTTEVNYTPDMSRKIKADILRDLKRDGFIK